MSETALPQSTVLLYDCRPVDRASSHQTRVLLTLQRIATNLTIFTFLTSYLFLYDFT